MANAVDGATRSYNAGALKHAAQRPSTSNDAPAEASTSAQADTAGTLNLGAAGAVQQLSKQLAQEAPIDRGRIEQIKAAISSGEYHVNPERISQKFTDLEKLLGKV